MAEASKQRIEEIICSVKGTMPGWSFDTPPQSFTWAPDRHFRACLINGDQKKNIIIRQSWDKATFNTETFLYRHVLPKGSVRVPELWGIFELGSDQSQWTILEDIGTERTNMDHSEDQKKFLAALGRLHGYGLTWLKEEPFTGPLLRFNGISLPDAGKFMPIIEWQERLARALEIPSFELPSWVISLPQAIFGQLRKQPRTLLHGDPNPSNGILSGKDAGLVDFERSFIGPPSIDLGEPAGKTDSLENWKEYQRWFQETSQTELSCSILSEWIDVGKGYDALCWISRYIEFSISGNPPDLDWRKAHYDPLLERIHQLYDKHKEWFTLSSF